MRRLARHIKGNQSGFTIAELLIVVAIIVVLVVIAVPVLTSQLEKSREATDLANVRAAYAEVMAAAESGDTSSASSLTAGVTCMHGRWYMGVNLEQKKFDWQTEGPFTIGSVSSNDPVHWVGKPSPNGICQVSYTAEGGAVIAWQYNFAPIMNDIPIPEGTYKGKTIAALLKSGEFSMFESSGTTGELIASQIRHQLGMRDSDDFSYKVMKAPAEYGPDHYVIYVSESYTLKTNRAKNQSNCGSIDVTGYVYRIGADGSSTLVMQGSTQTVSLYTNKNGQEKMDIDGNQDNCSTISPKAKNTPYKWNA